MIKRGLFTNIILSLTFVCWAQSVDKLIATQVAWANHIQHTDSRSMLHSMAVDTSKTEKVSLVNKAIMYKVQFEDVWLKSQ